MSGTTFNPSRFLSPGTRNAIKALGINLDDFASNIESRLRALGENDLANRMISEIEECSEERRMNRARRRAFESWGRDSGYSSPSEIPDDLAAKYL